MSDVERGRITGLVLEALREKPDASWGEIARAIGYRNGHALQAFVVRDGVTLLTLRQRAGAGAPPTVKEQGPKPETVEPSPEQQVAWLRSENSRILSAARAVEKRLCARAELDKALLDEVRRYVPLAPFSEACDAERPSVCAVLGLCDWHVAEVISLEEMEGRNEYNWEIAQQRIGYLMGKFLAWIDVQRRAYRIDECVVPVLGDLVSGEIHEELVRTNEMEPTTAAAKAGYELGRIVHTLAEKFATVRIEAIAADNHGRIDRKKPAKHKGERNWNYVAYEIAAASLRDCPNVTFNRPAAQKHLATIAKHRFLLEHGDNVRGWMGVPLYGMVRMRGREADRRSKDGGLDYNIVGHYHNPWHYQGMYGIGALCGTSELDEGQARHAVPSQTSFLVHPDHGIFNVVDWDLSAA